MIAIGVLREQSDRGFTLIELLVAMVIFAVMSAGIFTVFNNFQQVKETTDRDAHRLYEFQKAFAVLGRDIQQMVARPVRDEFGSSQPALLGEENQLEFTRTGWNRPPFIKTQRSELQRVKYMLEEGGLQRYYWDVLDRADSSLPKQLLVLENIEQIRFRYFHQSGQKQLKEVFSWPQQGNAINYASTNQGGSVKNGHCGIDQPGQIALPVFVEVIFVTSEFGEISKKFLIPFQYADAFLAHC